MQHRRAPSRSVLLCLGGSIDALRDSASPIGSLLIALTGWCGIAHATPPGRGARRGPGKISGKISGPGPGRPGAPAGGPRGAPPGPHFGAHFGAHFGGHIYIFLYSQGGPPGCPFWAPRGGPPGAPRGGAKSAHFFGYLITLPVGTVWALFLDPPGQGS